MSKLLEKEKKLKELEKDRKELFELKKPIEKALVQNTKKIEKIKNEIGKILIEENPNNWKILLDATNGDIVYKQYCEELRKRSLTGGNYLPETGQRCVAIALTKGDECSFNNTVSALKEILPSIYPFKKEEFIGYKYIDILESTLSQYGSFFIILNEEKEIFKLMKTVYGHTSEIKRFKNLEDIIKYVQKNIWYSKKEE